MKTLAAFLFAIILPFLSFSQNGNIFAEVDGDYVTLWHTETWRNCASQYQMFVDGEDFQITWLQYYNGSLANCMCYFDLSVTIGPLEPGRYNADVFGGYGIPTDSVYFGSTQFTIEENYRIDSLGIVEEYQSDCYQIDNISITDAKKVMLKVFPNPAVSVAVLQCTVNTDGELFVFNSIGQIVRHITDIEQGESTFDWNLSEKGHNINPGFYTVILQTEAITVIKKLIIY